MCTRRVQQAGRESAALPLNGCAAGRRRHLPPGGATAKAIAVADLAADIRGQRHAINLLQAIAPLLPAAAQEGIAHALASIAASLDAQAARLDRARAHAPAALRPDIRLAIRKAHRGAADARS